jgi:methionine synthase II (cobalamin-independent)
MRWSDERILTTHTGSLPRPPELTRLYVRRARGEAIDRAELDRVGKAALRRIVDKQIEAGIDIGNNGEQQREAFFLYVRHRMSGFGDSWQRWPRGDVERVRCEPVSRGNSPSYVEKPRFSAGVRAGASGAVGRDAQDAATSGLRAVISLSRHIPVPHRR